MVVEIGSIGFPTSSLVSCMSKKLKGTTDSVRDGPDNTPLEKQRSHPTMCANPPRTGHEDAHQGANAPYESGRFLPMVLVFQGVVKIKRLMERVKDSCVTN